MKKHLLFKLNLFAMSELALQLIEENKRTQDPFLDLGCCGLENELPKELFECVEWLKELNLGAYYFDKERKGWTRTQNSKVYNTFNGLELEVISKFNELQGLYISNNQIVNINFLEKLKNLRIINLSGNKIIDYTFLEKLEKLQTLNLSANRVENYTFLERLKKLQVIYLSSNQIKDISFLEKLSNLQKLNLSNNQIEDYSFLEKLTSLRTLNLSNNRIEDISFLEKLTNLQSLYLHSNQIEDISVLEKLKDLQKLDLHFNQIKDADILEKLINLEKLYISENEIENISFLENLTRIQSLDLSSNKIINIKPILPLLKNNLKIDLENKYIDEFARSIGLKDNHITNPPLEIVKQGKEAVVKYFENIDKNEKKGIESTEIREIKIILLGEGDSGKTTLMKRLIGKEIKRGEKQTQGIKQVVWNISHPEGNIQANLWDFGGQEIQHSTHQFFLTEECIYILVLDNRREEQPEYWLQHILSLGKNSRVLVVSNKIDNPEQASDRFNQNFLRTKYPFIYNFYKISALYGTYVEELRVELLKLIYQHSYPKFGADWMNVKKYIEEEIRLGKNYITATQLHEYCENKIDEQDEKIILNYMKNIGKVSFYRKNLLTRSFYILNPEWLIYALYKIILSVKTITQKGEIHIDDFDEILKRKDEYRTFGLPKIYEYEKEHYGYLLEMMKEYGLCYTADNQKIIIPSAFSEYDTKTFQETEQSLSFYFQYLNFLPPSIISQFIANIFEYRHKYAYWRSGIELFDSETNTSLLVYVDREQKRIYILANGEQKRKFFDFIRRKLKEINAKLPEMRIEERIPLQSKEFDQSVDYEELINHELDNREIYYHGKTREEFNVSELLSSIELKNITNQELNKRRAMENERINIQIDNRQQIEQKVEQKNINTNSVNLKIDVSSIKEFETIKELLLDIEDFNTKNEDWKNALVKALDEFHKIEAADEKPKQKTSISILERTFKKLKDIKDVFAIGFLPVDIEKKWPELLQQWETFKGYFN